MELDFMEHHIIGTPPHPFKKSGPFTSGLKKCDGEESEMTSSGLIMVPTDAVSDEAHLPPAVQKTLQEIRDELKRVLKKKDWETASLLKERIGLLKAGRLA